MGLDIYSNNKNPYEIRLELLKLAQEIVDRDYWQKQQKVDAMYNHLIETGEYDAAKKLEFPETPKAAQVLKVAEELKTFVDNKQES